MSNQSGITASEKLKKFLGSCRDGRCRLLKICITDGARPQLELEASIGLNSIVTTSRFINLTLNQSNDRLPLF